MAALKVYIAGPDVFRTDALAWAAEVRRRCLALGLEALIPLDGDASTPAGIYANNIDMIRAADAVVANLKPFRGAEPDSGTCFEVGFALALGKPVVGYLHSAESLCERVARLQGSPLVADGECVLDAEGWRVENFDLPLNLMLAVPVKLVADLEQALLAVVHE
ncbi:nucleoside 2-deoxyribosyltransferase [Uliginosibacterium sp. H3]|uniref:Nucleoside 2-deoxyribosyltransferase n=1 Tax=Uliginosibacterium silvisoli TaxID=3114758 RepID=A0ABU6JY59_9RHOO|nr:nucleoside 2-deoxyribosyltransferase [Uliginosibacterium sp. H3]